MQGWPFLLGPFCPITLWGHPSGPYQQSAHVPRRGALPHQTCIPSRNAGTAPGQEWSPGCACFWTHTQHRRAAHTAGNSTATSSPAKPWVTLWIPHAMPRADLSVLSQGLRWPLPTPMLFHGQLRMRRPSPTSLPFPVLPQGPHGDRTREGGKAPRAQQPHHLL